MHALSLADTGSRPGTTGIFSRGVVEVKVEKATDLDDALNEAVALMLEGAAKRKNGILVTRMGVGRYIVQEHPEVPIGLIRERYV